MERGMKIPQSERTKTTDALLLSLMNQLEKDRKTIKLGPEDNLYIEGFALNVFGKADKQDHAGRADLNTAKAFYASSIFFEILNQFGTLQPDLEQQKKYAAWKAADIRKALKEGRKPTPGPPADDDDLSIPSNTPSNRYDFGTAETTVTSPGPESDLPHNYHDPVNYQHSPSIHATPEFHDTINKQHSTNIPPVQFHGEVGNNQNSSNISPSSPPYSYSSAYYPSQDYPPPSQDYHRPSSSQDYHSPPPAGSEGPHSMGYNHQQYSPDYSQHLVPNNPSHETSSYPHFQSYPSFSESILPSVPSNYTYYRGSDASSYSSQSAPLTTNQSSSTQQNPLNINGSVSESKSINQTYQYDSSYQPPPEKIAEAHKAARFAVGALAFDDVSTAVDFLRKSLELLANPSSRQQEFT